jgi:hypothetical protein
MSEEYSKNAKQFLERQLIDYEIKIKKLKKRRKIVKALFASLIIISVTSSTVCATVAGLALPPAIYTRIIRCCRSGYSFID